MHIFLLRCFTCCIEKYELTKLISLEITLSNMSSSLEKLVPMLEGQNYLGWANAMKSYLKSQGSWQVASGGYIKLSPVAATITNAAQIKKHRDETLEWSNKDDAAFGMIMLHVNASLQQLIASKNDSKDAWDTLATSLCAQGPALTYSDFKTTLQIKVSVANPAMEIAKMATIFDRLRVNNVIIPEIVRAMILLAASLHEYESVSSVLLQNYDNTTLTLEIVKNALIADAQRCSTVLRQQQNHNYHHIPYMKTLIVEDVLSP